MPIENTILLSRLVKEMAYTTKGNLEGIRIRAITSDSKQVREGDLFVAIQGTKQDGHHYLEEAIFRGASVVVVERPYSHPRAKVLQVSDSKKALSYLAAAYYRFPSKELKAIGVTGTNGKTTVTYLLEELFKEEGIGILGTISYRIGARVIPAIQTTPPPFEVQAFLRQMADGGCRYAALEVSSHALDQSRVKNVDFQVGIFTNLSQDHLDYHQTMEAYGEAKLTLFRDLSPSAWAIVNGEDSLSGVIVTQTKAKILTYGFGPEVDVRVEAISFNPNGMEVTVSFPIVPTESTGPRETLVLHSALMGRYNVYNLLASFATGLVFGKSPNQMKEALVRLEFIPGRLEKISVPLKVFVDYAHTPEGLKQVLTTLREITPGRLWVVFGCGGDRDRGKRPKMGRIAVELADGVFITSDNPRSENPEQIIEEILEGIRPLGVKGMAKVRVVVDRSTAIREAIFSASDTDTVLLAGKGHENHQIFRDVTVPFDDRDEAHRWLKKREARHVSVG